MVVCTLDINSEVKKKSHKQPVGTAAIPWIFLIKRALSLRTAFNLQKNIHCTVSGNYVYVEFIHTRPQLLSKAVGYMYTCIVDELS